MSLTNRIGLYAIELIRKQVDDGIDIDGSKYAYSEKPFFMPYRADVVKKFGGKQGKDEYYRIVKRDGKRKGLIILKGYKSYRQAYQRDPDGDFLQFTGNMLASMKIVSENKDEVELGFSDKKSTEIALYLNVTGAGRGRKLWRFFGLTEENQDKLSNLDDKITMEDIDKLVSKMVANAEKVI